MPKTTTKKTIKKPIEKKDLIEEEDGKKIKK